MHFISGLPRSGSSMLAAILRQNPVFRASMSSPVSGIFSSLLQSMSGANPFASRMTDTQRYQILRSMFEAYYGDNDPGQVIFDTSRRWCRVLPVLCCLFPEARVICCVRSPAWILDSIEQQVQRNAIQPSKLFGHDADGTVYHRAATLLNDGFVGRAIKGLRQAWFGPHTGRLIAVRYDSMTQQPQQTIEKLYENLHEELYSHDFEHLEYDEPEFDAEIGLPGFHKVSGRVEPRPRATILPPDLFRRYDDKFWDDPAQNPRNVKVL
jgi:sulfotransferase